MSDASIDYHQPAQVTRLQDEDSPDANAPVTSSRQRKIRMKTKDHITKMAEAFLDELEKIGAMSPVMKAQQAKFKARMDDKDGDGKKEPDTEELSVKERIARMKKKK